MNFSGIYEFAKRGAVSALASIGLIETPVAAAATPDPVATAWTRIVDKEWHDYNDHLLGLATDAVVAEWVGATPYVVRRARLAKGVASFVSRKPWTDRDLELLAKTGVKQCAVLTGRTVAAVKAKKKKVDDAKKLNQG